MNLPEETGVYFFYDEAGELLYVGKAKNIKKRVAQHKRDSTPWKKRIARIDFILNNNEEEALLSEQSIIKRLSPRYNVRLRDDKSYPYIAISWDEEYPRIFLTREKRKAERKYFGPYLNSRQARKIVQTLPKILPFRSCQGEKPGREKNPCLDWHLGLCQAPCVNYTSKEEYRKNISSLEKILRGESQAVEQELQEKMKQHSLNHEFEQAALLRDRLKALGTIRPRQNRESDIDALIFLQDRVFLSRLRSGQLVESTSIKLKSTKESSLQEKALAFLFQHYENAPKEILLESDVYRALGAERGVFEKSRKTKIVHPRQGPKARFLEQSKKTALFKEASEGKRSDEPLKIIEDWLGLSVERIEAYDVSNFGKDHTYVSLVVFENGEKKAAHYRLFSIKNREKADDYGALQEALERRKRAWEREQEKKQQGKTFDRSLGEKPDLVLIDGGPGQLGVARKSLDGFIDTTQIFSLAKKEETLFSCDGPLPWESESVPLLFLRKIRDEAHRFALKNSRLALQKSAQASPLEEIDGIGKKRRQALEDSSLDISKATIEQLEDIQGISPKMAEKIYRHFHRR